MTRDHAARACSGEGEITLLDEEPAVGSSPPWARVTPAPSVKTKMRDFVPVRRVKGEVFGIAPRAIRCGGAQPVGATFEVHLTPGAIDALRIESGKQVWLVIKTYSCNLVEPSVRCST
jgi:hypothetical protein